jgi:hypothetical protein
MPDTRPLRIAQKILVEFTVYQLEDGAPNTLEQMRAAMTGAIIIWQYFSDR